MSDDLFYAHEGYQIHSLSDLLQGASHYYFLWGGQVVSYLLWVDDVYTGKAKAFYQEIQGIHAFMKRHPSLDILYPKIQNYSVLSVYPASKDLYDPSDFRNQIFSSYFSLNSAKMADIAHLEAKKPLLVKNHD